MGRFSSKPCTSIWPCEDDFFRLYGDSEVYFSRRDLYAQISLYSIFGFILFCIVAGTPLTMKHALRSFVIKVAGALYVIGVIFLCVRYGLLLSGMDAMIGFRFESSIALMFLRGGMVFLFPCVLVAEAEGLWMVGAYTCWVGYACLAFAQVVVDFVISGEALKAYKKYYVENSEYVWGRKYRFASGLPPWWLGDRDFSLVFTKDQVRRLLFDDDKDFSLMYVQERMYDGGFANKRNIGVHIGITTEVLGFTLALFIALANLQAWRAKPNQEKNKTKWFAIAGIGLFITALFQIIVAIHYTFWNWKVISDDQQWLNWNPGSNNTFLPDYRTTVDGFPILQAVFEPLGVTMAFVSIAWYFYILDPSR